MTYNIMNEYITYTRKFLKDFMKEYFRDRYNEEISEEYIDTYIEARYRNYGGNENQRFFYRRIYSALQKTEKQLKEDFKEEQYKIIDNMLETYQYIFYIDFVRPLKIELKDFVNQMYEKRTTKFEMERTVNLKENLYRMIKKFRDKKENYLEEFDSNDFELETVKYPLIKDIYKVNLKYKFNMPYVYSDEVIEEVYNEDVINEDKLMIEYLMLTVLNIKNINYGKFNTQYLVDFPTTLFEKAKKMEQMLRIINDPAIQDKIKIKIKNKDFVEYKEIIYELMKRGYKFALILDDSFTASQEEIRKLSIFDYIILNKSLEKYDELKQYERQIENLIIDEG